MGSNETTIDIQIIPIYSASGSGTILSGTLIVTIKK